MADNTRISEDSCLVCGETGQLKRCMRCKIAKYCCKEHQVQNWKIHKLRCGKQGANDSQSPSTTNKTDTATADSPGAAGPQADKDQAQAGDDGEPFDERPLRISDFSKPKSNSDNDIMEYCVEQMKEDGFCVLDNLLTDKECKAVLSEVQGLESGGKMQFGKLAGGQASNMKEEMVVNNDIRGDKIVWLEGDEPSFPAISHLVTKRMDSFVLPLTAHFGGDIVLSGRTKAMVACYPGEGAGYRRHVDNPDKDGRIVTCIFYINNDWDAQKTGGALRIFPASRPGDYVDVAPLMNRLLLFWSDRRTPHEVQPAHASRYAITIWYFNAEERAKAKEAQVNAAIRETEQKLVDVKLRTKEMEREMIQKKVETTTASAINMLSEEELAALTHMIAVSEDPKALLTKMNIAPILQDSLLETIERRKAKCNITVLA